MTNLVNIKEKASGFVLPLSLAILLAMNLIYLGRLLQRFETVENAVLNNQNPIIRKSDLTTFSEEINSVRNEVADFSSTIRNEQTTTQAYVNRLIVLMEKKGIATPTAPWEHPYKEN